MKQEKKKLEQLIIRVVYYCTEKEFLSELPQKKMHIKI